MYQSFEDYVDDMIKEGLISENGAPLKCHKCEGKNFIEYDHDYLDYCYGHGVNLLEYKVKCETCKTDVGYWVAGNWQF